MVWCEWLVAGRRWGIGARWGLGLGLGASCVGIGIAVAFGGEGVVRGLRAIRSAHHCCWCLWVKIHMPSRMSLQYSSTRLPVMVSSWWMSGLMSSRSLLLMRRVWWWVW